MGEFKKKLQDINNPAVHNRRSIQRIGKVTKTHRNSSKCLVEFVDKDGYMSNKEAIVKINNPSILWLPNEGELVNLLIEENGAVTIDSPFNGDYKYNTKHNYKLKEDIYSNNFGGTSLGCIL